jgi:hypothetical protein
MPLSPALLALGACFALAGCYDRRYYDDYDYGYGELTFSWRLAAERERGPTLACRAGDFVRLTAQNVQYGDVTRDEFDCARGAGTSRPLPARSDYDVTLDLLDAAGNLLSRGHGATYLPAGAVADLGLVTFVVSGQPAPSGFAVALAWGRPDGADNACLSGAAAFDVHRTTFTLHDAAGNPIVASTPLGTGACEALPGEPCHDVLDFGELPAGTYRLSVSGLSVTCAPCWPSQSFLLVHEPGVGPQTVEVRFADGCF